MLAGISCYCKIMVFSPFELGNIMVNHPKVTNEVALSNIQMPLKCTVKIGYNTSKYASNFKFPIITH